MLMKDERFFKTIKNFLEIYLLKQKKLQQKYAEILSGIIESPASIF